MFRRDFLKVLGIGVVSPKTIVKPKFKRDTKPGEPKFKVGDIVKYVKHKNKAWGGDLADRMNESAYNRNSKFFGNKMIVETVNEPCDANKGVCEVSYSVRELDPVPFNAWHDESTLELFKPIEEFLEG